MALSVVCDAPRRVARDGPRQHERRLALHHRRRQVARAEAQPQGARAHERDVERQRRIAVVLRAWELGGRRPREADVDLVEVERRLERVSVPLQRAAPGRDVERGEAAGGEKRLLRFAEVESDVDDVAEVLRGGIRGASRRDEGDGHDGGPEDRAGHGWTKMVKTKIIFFFRAIFLAFARQPTTHRET